MGKIIRYEHHGYTVAVDEKLKGCHRKHCLCFRCRSFAPDTKHNCPIAEWIFGTARRFILVTPVYECPQFIEGKPDLSMIKYKYNRAGGR